MLGKSKDEMWEEVEDNERYQTDVEQERWEMEQKKKKEPTNNNMNKEIKALQEKARKEFKELTGFDDIKSIGKIKSLHSYHNKIIEQTYKQGREDVNKDITECIATLDYSKNGDVYERGAWDAINDILKHLTNKQ